MATPDVVTADIGRRERNKQVKLERITAAARSLFDAHGVDEVTTQQIADEADIGTGTLFLYAKTKGELLLLVQNSAYSDALVRGRADAEGIADTVEAVMAIVRPVVECNRKHVENGRTYLREMIFGDAAEPHHQRALDLSQQTELAIADVITRDSRVPSTDGAILARVISALMLVGMASPGNVSRSVTEIVDELERHIRVVLRVAAEKHR